MAGPGEIRKQRDADGSHHEPSGIKVRLIWVADLRRARRGPRGSGDGCRAYKKIKPYWIKADRTEQHRQQEGQGLEEPGCRGAQMGRTMGQQ